MSLRGSVVFALVLLVGAAHADPPTPGELLRDRTLRNHDAPADDPVRLHVDGLIAATGTRADAAERSTPTLSVGGELVVAGSECDLLTIDGQLDVADDDSRAAIGGAQSAALCLRGTFGRFELRHHLTWDGEPRLLAPPLWNPGASRREALGLSFAFRSKLQHTEEALEVMPVAIDTSFAVGGGSSDPAIAVSVGMLRYRRPSSGNRAVELSLLDSAIQTSWPHARREPGLGSTTRSAATIAVDVLRLEGLPVLGTRVSWAIGMGTAFVDVATTAMATQRTMGFLGRGQLRVERDVGPAVASFTAHRALWTTHAGQGVIDERITASVAGRRDDWHAQLELSVARTRVIAAEAVAHLGLGGVTASIDRALGRYTTARAYLEVGRSVYAPGASFAGSRWGAEGIVALAIHAGDR